MGRQEAKLKRLRREKTNRNSKIREQKHTFYDKESENGVFKRRTWNVDKGVKYAVKNANIKELKYYSGNGCSNTKYLRCGKCIWGLGEIQRDN